MFKQFVLLCVVLCVVVEARPKWQFLPPVPGYVPVYIRTGDTPLEEINLELAEAFHALPAGRSAGKHLEASPEEPQDSEVLQSPEEPKTIEEPKSPEQPPHSDLFVDHRPYDKKAQERKLKKVNVEIQKSDERR